MLAGSCGLSCHRAQAEKLGQHKGQQRHQRGSGKQRREAAPFNQPQAQVRGNGVGNAGSQTKDANARGQLVLRQRLRGNSRRGRGGDSPREAMNQAKNQQHAYTAAQAVPDLADKQAYKPERQKLLQAALGHHPPGKRPDDQGGDDKEGGYQPRHARCHAKGHHILGQCGIEYVKADGNQQIDDENQRKVAEAPLLFFHAMHLSSLRITAYFSIPKAMFLTR